MTKNVTIKKNKKLKKINIHVKKCKKHKKLEKVKKTNGQNYRKRTTCISYIFYIKRSHKRIETALSSNCPASARQAIPTAKIHGIAFPDIAHTDLGNNSWPYTKHTTVKVPVRNPETKRKIKNHIFVITKQPRTFSLIFHS